MHLDGVAWAAPPAPFVSELHDVLIRVATAIQGSGRLRRRSPKEAVDLVEHQGQLLWRSGFLLG